MKKVLFVSRFRPSTLPPFLALIDVMLNHKEYDIKVIAGEEDPEIDELYKDKSIEFIHYYDRNYSKNPFIRRFQIYKKKAQFYFGVKRDIERINPDLLWVIHEATAIRISRLLTRPFILSVYELNDTFPQITKKLIPITRKAKVNIACEYNRSQMMKLWYNLPEAPVVLPNKPYTHPRSKNIPTSTIVDQLTDKIILYQGRMYPGERNLEALCEAVSRMKGFVLVLMGHKNAYSQMLIDKYPSVKLIDYIKAPFHLAVTSHAYIGVVTYSYNCLDTIYCAPNKIWEYSGFSIPMIANDIPGLKYTVEAAKSGLCVDTDDPDAIIQAIEKIDRNYDHFKANAIKMYDQCNITEIVENVLNKFFS